MSDPLRHECGLAFIRLLKPLAYFQAFVAGSLVHIVAFGVSHRHDGHVEPPSAGPGPRGDWGYRLGILVGLFVLFTAPHIGGQG